MNCICLLCTLMFHLVYKWKTVFYIVSSLSQVLWWSCIFSWVGFWISMWGIYCHFSFLWIIMRINLVKMWEYFFSFPKHLPLSFELQKYSVESSVSLCWFYFFKIICDSKKFSSTFSVTSWNIAYFGYVV